jgi:hypothetical protein
MQDALNQITAAINLGHPVGALGTLRQALKNLIAIDQTKVPENTWVSRFPTADIKIVDSQGHTQDWWYDLTTGHLQRES